jgi:DNA-binding LytR/AlgR family response regulator
MKTNKNPFQPKILKGILDKSQIIFMESDINRAVFRYTIIHLSDDSQRMSAYHLKFHENSIDIEQFMPVNRSHLINKTFVERVNFNDSNNQITLRNGENILVSRRRLKAIKEQYGFVVSAISMSFHSTAEAV